MKKNSGVHLINKKIGETPKEAILRYKSENPKFDHLSMTYAGRLDPMAKGLLLVLSGDELIRKDMYLDLPKTYEFEILWGFETDTADLLGLQVKSRKLKVKSEIPKEKEIKEYLKKSVGKFEQLYPIYSSRPVGGKSLFQWAREGKINQIEIPKHDVELFEGSFISRKEISKIDLLDDIITRVTLVNGDFRQEEIMEEWKKAVSRSVLDTLTIDRIKIEVSSGFYVRQFVSDLARESKALATTFSIKRESIGSFVVAII